ncbi:UDP-N-acetylglucosamine 4,6-dehydratase (inverting) [Amylibacter sp.]|nr:UDP-N-acetylglucosamine 4,6-dehydratase (inverting) [Amylibacter sp.]
MFNNSTVLITGGTGSFGKRFVQHLVSEYKCKKIIIYSRDEMKQWKMQSEFQSDNLRFFIGDVRDLNRLRRAMSGVDYVVHAAATKIVPIAEYNPFECIKTNINGAMNVIDAALDMGVKKVVALSTDKASSPVNLYGATKLASDKLFVSANSYSGETGTSFSVVRYGNVMGSRGSVIPLFLEQCEKGFLTITDKRMTRFMITLDDGVKLVEQAFDDMIGGEIYVKKIPSMNILEIADAVFPGGERKIIGSRPGEKLHEQMIGIEDAPFTLEFDDYYKILPNLHDWYLDENRRQNGLPVRNDFVYDSARNEQKMSTKQLRIWIDANVQNFESI